MFCAKCGKEQVGNPNFCRNCGANLCLRDILPKEVSYTYYEESSKEGVRWNFGRILSLLIRAATLTAILYYVLLYISAAIASSILPDDIHYSNDGWCDVGNERAEYILTTADGQMEGEYCYLHAVVYDIAVEVRPDEGAINECPIEIRLLSRWSFLLVAVLVSAPVAWWWVSRKARQEHEKPK